MSPDIARPAPDGGRIVASRYALREPLGTGGMATVYRADDLSLGRVVAIKLFHAELTNSGDERRQREEITLLAGLNHPALVTLFDAGRDSDDAYLAMEYVAGSDLRERLLTGALTPRIVASIGADIASALSYIHARNVVHRDIKPANVLLPVDAPAPGAPQAKLADFGIARLIDSTRLTATGTLIGTASFLSPEQAKGEAVGPPTDVYSLGLVLLESLTGARAFPGSPAESAIARLSRDPEIPERLGSAWSTLLAGATSREPGRRPTADELARQLRLLADDESGSGLSPTDDATVPLHPSEVPDPPTRAYTAAATEPLRNESTPPASRRRRTPIVVAAAAAAVLVVVGAIALASLPRTEPTAQPTTPVTVQYPVVEGDLGAHLTQLQESVLP